VASPATTTGWAPIRGKGKTAADGLFQLCTDAIEPGARIAVVLRRDGHDLGRLEQNLATEALTLIPVVIRP
jgi:hypothetical protein